MLTDFCKVNNKFVTHSDLEQEKAMAPHSSVLAWRIPGTGEPGGLPSMGSHRVGHDWSDLAAAAAAADLEHKLRWKLQKTFYYWCSPDQIEGKMEGGWE